MTSPQQAFYETRACTDEGGRLVCLPIGDFPNSSAVTCPVPDVKDVFPTAKSVERKLSGRVPISPGSKMTSYSKTTSYMNGMLAALRRLSVITRRATDFPQVGKPDEFEEMSLNQ